MENEQDAEYRKAQMDARIKEMETERENLKYMDKSEYIVRESMINNALGDSELFEKEIMTIDAIKEE